MQTISLGFFLFSVVLEFAFLCFIVGASPPNAEMVFKSQVNINHIHIFIYFCSFVTRI